MYACIPHVKLVLTEEQVESCDHERKTRREERRLTVVRWRKDTRAESNKSASYECIHLSRN